MQKRAATFGAFLLSLSLALGGLVLADHLETGETETPILITNQTGSDATNVQLPFLLSSQTLTDGFYMDSDALDTAVLEGSAHIPYMPGTGRVQVLSCFDEASNNETTDCNDVGADDITLPTTATATFEFALDNQANSVWVNVGTAAVATDWNVTWMYYNGTSYVTASNVTDGTEGFTVSGLKKVSWDFPAAGAWPEATLHSVNGYWVQARVDNDPATTVTTEPLGTQAWYETGRWWVYEDAISNNEQKRYDVELDIAATAAVTGSFTIAANADDFEVRGSGGTYPPAFTSTTDATLNRAQKNFDVINYIISEPLLRFDTSSIPDGATITDGSLSCINSGVSDDNARSVLWEWYSWEGASGSDYTTITQANAHTGTSLSDVVGVGLLQTFDLTNLHNVNKSGYTGLRAHISGGSPPGGLNENSIAFQDSSSGSTPCTLDLTWEVDKDYHWYVPHSGGVTLSDDAGLEPGSNFELTIAGYFNTDSPGTIRYGNKGGDLVVYTDGTSQDIRVNVNNPGSPTLVGAMTSGYHTVTLTQGGTAGTDELALLVDGVTVATTGSAAMTDNGSDWTFYESVLGNPEQGAMDYIHYEVNNATVFTWQIQDIPDYQLINHANPGTYDAIARYPDTLSGYASSTLATRPTAETEVTDDVGQALPGVAPPIGEIGNFTQPVTATAVEFPLNKIWWRLSGGDNPEIDPARTHPYEFWLALFAIATIITVLVIVMIIFKSAAVAYFVGIVLFIIFWKWGNLPWWMIPAWGMAASPALFWRRMPFG